MAAPTLMATILLDMQEMQSWTLTVFLCQFSNVALTSSHMSFPKKKNDKGNPAFTHLA
jgi:hypothetical protein